MIIIEILIRLRSFMGINIYTPRFFSIVLNFHFVPSYPMYFFLLFLSRLKKSHFGINDTCWRVLNFTSVYICLFLSTVTGPFVISLSPFRIHIISDSFNQTRSLRKVIFFFFLSSFLRIKASVKRINFHFLILYEVGVPYQAFILNTYK